MTWFTVRPQDPEWKRPCGEQSVSDESERGREEIWCEREGGRERGTGREGGMDGGRESEREGKEGEGGRERDGYYVSSPYIIVEMAGSMYSSSRKPRETESVWDCARWAGSGPETNLCER